MVWLRTPRLSPNVARAQVSGVCSHEPSVALPRPTGICPAVSRFGEGAGKGLLKIQPWESAATSEASSPIKEETWVAFDPPGLRAVSRELELQSGDLSVSFCISGDDLSSPVSLRGYASESPL